MDSFVTSWDFNRLYHKLFRERMFSKKGCRCKFQLCCKCNSGVFWQKSVFEGWKILSSLCLCCNPIALTQPPLAVSIKERRLVPQGFWMNALLSRKQIESACFNFWQTKLSAINLSFGFTLHQTGSNEAKKGWKIDQGRLSTWEESPPQATGPLS